MLCLYRAPPPAKHSHSKAFQVLQQKHAFTLAEVLITLTIIGVIAAMTIPTLMSKYQKHTYVVGLKRTYSLLQHALKMIPITEGCSGGDYSCAGFNEFFDGSNVTDVDGIKFSAVNALAGIYRKRLYLISKNLKTRKRCIEAEGGNGLLSPDSDECKKLVIDPDGVAHETIQLEDGTIIDRRGYVDINGLNGPNKWGRDRFAFQYTPNHDSVENSIPDGTLLPFGSRIYAEYFGYGYYWNGNWVNGRFACTNINIEDWTDLKSCTGRVLEEGAMNY